MIRPLPEIQSRVVKHVSGKLVWPFEDFARRVLKPRCNPFENMLGIKFNDPHQAIDIFQHRCTGRKHAFTVQGNIQDINTSSDHPIAVRFEGIMNNNRARPKVSPALLTNLLKVSSKNNGHIRCAVSMPSEPRPFRQVVERLRRKRNQLVHRSRQSFRPDPFSSLVSQNVGNSLP